MEEEDRKSRQFVGRKYLYTYIFMEPLFYDFMLVFMAGTLVKYILPEGKKIILSSKKHVHCHSICHLGASLLFYGKSIKKTKKKNQSIHKNKS